MADELTSGQLWHYPAPEGFEDSRILIGAIEPYENGDDIVCIMVLNAPVPRRNGLISRATIPFLPFSKSAVEATVTELDEDGGEIPNDFHQAHQAWKDAPDGMEFFQVPLPALLAELYQALQDENNPLNAQNE